MRLTPAPRHVRRSATLGLAAILGLLMAGPASAGEPGDAPPPIGINLSSVADWDGDKLFADAIKQARTWSKLNTIAQDADMDADGWPTHDASTVVWHGTAPMNGIYRLSFTGQADLSASYASVDIADLRYDPATNTTTATLTYPGEGYNGLLLNFAHTRRTPDSATNTGITNVRMMRPLAPGSSETYDPSVTFTTPIKEIIADFQVIRLMDTTGSNGGTELNGDWDARRLPGYWSQADESKPRGMAWEYAIQLANETDKDLWVNIPFPADDHYVTQLATLLRDTLEPERKLYVEYSNELWNWFGSFPYNDNKDRAVAEVKAGGSPLNYDGETSEHVWAMRRVAKRGKEVSDIFRSVFGDDQMPAPGTSAPGNSGNGDEPRVRPILSSQLGNAGATLMYAMLFLENYYNNSEHVPSPHPASYYFWGCGGTAYYSPDNHRDDLTADGILAELESEGYFTKPEILADVHWATSFGLKRVAYEGGPGLDKSGHSEQAKADAWNDPRMTAVIRAKQEQWSRAGGDLLMYFYSSSGTAEFDVPHPYYQWAFTDNVHDHDTPKLNGIDLIKDAPHAGPTIGFEVPHDAIPVLERHLDHNLGHGVADRLVKTHGWIGWTIRVPEGAGRKYAITTDAKDGTRRIFVDGVRVGDQTGADARPISVHLEPGLHGIRVEAAEGEFWISKLVVK